MKHYIDTSVLAAYYCPEPLSDRVQSFLAAELKPAVSDLTSVELFSAVARKVREGSLDRLDGSRILSKYQSHLDGGLFTVVPVESQHWRIAKGWIGLFNTSLRTLDALHLAVASGNELTVVTSDQRLLHAAEALGVPVRGIIHE